MTSTSIEIVLKTLLPKAASRPGWWIADKGDHASCSWKAAGFLAELQEGGHSVRFRKTSRTPMI